ncbi:MAG: TVP38/TMEM64 family protein [Gammaproteobacteria bacterium]|nr:MAG: TVP38/TMEM64 family protein [Gammaproteobacteria bacterium]
MRILPLTPRHKLLLFILFFCAGLYIFWSLETKGILEAFQDGITLKSYIAGSGIFGPFFIILFMTVAILISPIPSAPIALASGAAYGHYLGSIYVLIGAEVGAISAFIIARVLGCDVVRALYKGDVPFKKLNTQNALMGMVFLSRLMPFISFDIISYAAGLTSLSFWRFALATLAGIAPASFLLAHVGSELVATEIERVLIAVLIIGLIGIAPIIMQLLRNRSGQ